jgi:hypothetical protein
MHSLVAGELTRRSQDSASFFMRVVYLFQCLFSRSSRLQSDFISSDGFKTIASALLPIAPVTSRGRCFARSWRVRTAARCWRMSGSTSPVDAAAGRCAAVRLSVILPRDLFRLELAAVANGRDALWRIVRTVRARP